ncbi:hypothetical protein [Candidatus Chromulinivorax destructor]|uniref:Uncharacterized protein n=1 Tax=Candidatus Chromulinivorax destructor TaxID=2066483 RepID=A0A345ZAC2_9BACT|nr:hypothetical protein [Candidatus Chromulinivorax destructor]AXK60239.1 hypothetical protein C0J27_00540 [Candidatus Chromulinivorax destructor]
MNHFFKSLLFTLAMPCFISAGAMGVQMQPVSVHDMFKDLTEEQIVAYMEEGQREMERIMTKGTPEEQAEFMRMMEDTMKSFSPEDFEEINKIAQIVEPLLLEKEAEAFKAQEAKTIKPEPIKEPRQEMVSGDSSFEYMLHRINKTINGILLKVKSDVTLTSVLKQWDKKETFNELVRLLQALNNKNILAILTSAKNDDIKKLNETIENFSKRLEIENKQFNVADTFGLEIDKATSDANVLKFNKILEFFSGATETLLPMLTKFLQEFEPEALKLAKEHDDKAKSSLDAAKQIEKIKRPIGAYTGIDNNPSYGSSANYNPARNDYAGQNYTSASPQSRRAQNKMNYNGGAGNSQGAPNSSSMPGAPAAPADKTIKKEDPKEKKPEDKKADALKPVIDKIERYDDMFDNASYDEYRKALSKAGDIYKPYGKELLNIDDFNNNYNRESITNPYFNGPISQQERSLRSSLQPNLQKYNEKSAEFKKATQSAHTYYGTLKALIDAALPDIKELKSIVDATRTSLPSLNVSELDKLNNSPALKKLKSRFQSYEGLFNSTQKELQNKHKAHKIEKDNAEETKAYNELQAKVESLHGLDRVILDTRASFDLLDRAIKAEIKRKKRDAGKVN